MEHEPQSRAAASIERLRALQDDSARRRVETMERVKARFLKLDRHKALRRAIDDLLENQLLRFDPSKPEGSGNRVEARALLVTGETGAGKSFSLRRLFANHPAFPGYDDPASDSPLVSVNVRAPSTFLALGRETARRVGYPVQKRVEAHIIWERVYQHIELRGIFGLHFDEMHNVLLSASDKDRYDIQNTIKTLMTRTEWPCFVIVSGLPLVRDFIEQACEDRRRCRTVHFASLRLPEDVKKVAAMLSSLCETAGIRCEVKTLKFVVPRLIHAAFMELGTALELTHEAINQALHASASQLETSHFTDAFAMRTGNMAGANPFCASDWATIDCSKILMRDADTSIVSAQAKSR